jgi:hypothetical protein
LILAIPNDGARRLIKEQPLMPLFGVPLTDIGELDSGTATTMAIHKSFLVDFCIKLQKNEKTYLLLLKKRSCKINHFLDCQKSRFLLHYGELCSDLKVSVPTRGDYTTLTVYYESLWV